MIRALLGNLICAIACLSATAARADGGPAKPAAGKSQASLELANGDHLTGKLLASPDKAELIWQSPAFTAPLRFPLKTIEGVHFAVPAKLPQPSGEYGFELAGDDLVYGSLVALANGEAVLEVAGVGPLHIDQSIIRRMYRWKGAELIFLGPSGLAGWKTRHGNWREDAGQLMSEQKGSQLYRDFKVPPLARFEIQLSWKEKPDFDVALGVGDDPKTSLRAFHFAVWENDIVAARETEREADVAALQSIEPGAGRLHVQAFLDQPRGRLLVFSSGGKQLADLTVTTRKPQSFGGLEVLNRGGDLRLESLRISRWNGEAPRAVESDKARVHASDGSITYGQLTKYDADKREFVIDDEGEDVRVAEERVQDVFLSHASEAAPRSVRLVSLSGLRLGGALEKVTPEAIWLKCPGIREPISSPLESIHALMVLKNESKPLQTSGKQGRLELEGTVLHGALVDGRETTDSCLVWQPTQSHSAGALVHGVSARIIYRDPPPPPKPQAQSNVSVRVVAPGGLIGAIFGGTKTTTTTTSSSGSKTIGHVLHLLTGDTIVCRVTSIDEEGVTFTSTVTDATFVPHKQIKALELVPDASVATITKSKKERLLTLPRMQRNNPPTQLIRSLDGDYLRGRLLAMDDKQATIEIRLETRSVPRGSIARILWLHADQASAEKPAGAQQSSRTRVQSMPRDGHRLTFFAEQLAGTTLSGRSELLGACHVDLKQLDQLLIGSAIETAAAELAFHQWKLKDAAEPLPVSENPEGGGDSEGVESPLVGKQAPDIALSMVDGQKFQLAELRGKVVILDFWASWCGPCLQTMPLVEKVADEFAKRNVKLVAINLQETPEQVRTALGRLKLNVSVALDSDGRTAERYGATAIPQTVIIDRNGKVARVFVGSSARFDEQLRKALETVLAGEADKK